MLPSCEWISDGVNNLCRFTREYPPHQWTSLFSSRGRIEDLCRELEVERAFAEVPIALALIRAEAHSRNIRL